MDSSVSGRTNDTVPLGRRHVEEVPQNEPSRTRTSLPPSSSSSPNLSLTTVSAHNVAQSALMPPPARIPAIHTVKRPKRVLDEETYTATLSHIIQRDFFPGLHETHLKNEYLDALDAQDEAWIAAVVQKLRATALPPSSTAPARTETPGSLTQTPRTQTSTPSESTLSSSGSSLVSKTPGQTPTPDPFPIGHSLANVDTSLSLADFQAAYTSEDNESFYQLVDRQNLRNLHKKPWFWPGNDNLLPSKQRLAQHQVLAKLLRRPATKHTNDQPLLAQERFLEQMALEPQRRPAQPETWKPTTSSALVANHHPARNAFMFPAPGMSDESGSPAQQATAQSRAPPKQIQLGNTRGPNVTGASITRDSIDKAVLGDEAVLGDGAAPTPTLSTTIARARASSPTLSAVREAVSGHVRDAFRDASVLSDVASTCTPTTTTPLVQGYAFVEEDDDARPAPSSSSSRLTAAELRLLSGATATDDAAAKNPFHLQAPRRREGVHHRMVDRMHASHRATSSRGPASSSSSFFSPSSRLSPSRQPSLSIASPSLRARKSAGLNGDAWSPAAQRLLEHLGKSPRVDSNRGGGAGGNFGRLTPFDSPSRSAATPRNGKHRIQKRK